MRHATGLRPRKGGANAGGSLERVSRATLSDARALLKAVRGFSCVAGVKVRPARIWRRRARRPVLQPLRGGWRGLISTRLNSACEGERRRSITTSATSAGVNAQPDLAEEPRPNSVATLPGIRYETRMPS